MPSRESEDSLISPEVTSTYEILEQIGRGGMGAVYKARHRAFGELCVIKVIVPQYVQSAALRERFENEARRGRQIDHPNIARVLNFFIGANGNPHLVTEYIDGTTLRETFARTGVLPALTVVGIALQALDALECLHSHKLVHRDISPENLMVTKAGGGVQTVKLIDLGITKSLEDTTSLTQYGAFLGKPLYAAPEQFSGIVDARSDLYSLGVVLYEIATGVRPISGASVDALARAHGSMPPLPFTQSDPKNRVPEPLRRAILKALEKDPGKRFQNAREFIDALRAVWPSPEAATFVVPYVTPAPAPPPAPQPEVKQRVWTRQRTIAIASPVVAVALIVVIVTLKTAFDDRKDDSDEGKTETTEITVTAPPPAQVLTPELARDFAVIVRRVVARGGTPAADEPEIASFLATNRLSYDAVRTLANEIAAVVTSANEAITRGKALIASGKTSEAIAAFAEAKERDPDSSLAWTNYGAAAMLMNDPGEAAKAYDRALALDPRNWLAHYNRACRFARIGRPADALNDVRSAVFLLREQKPARELAALLENMRNDEALGELRNDREFQKLVAVQ